MFIFRKMSIGVNLRSLVCQVVIFFVHIINIDTRTNHSTLLVCAMGSNNNLQGFGFNQALFMLCKLMHVNYTPLLLLKSSLLTVLICKTSCVTHQRFLPISQEWRWPLPHCIHNSPNNNFYHSLENASDAVGYRLWWWSPLMLKE